MKEQYQQYSLYIFGVDGVIVQTKSGSKFRRDAQDWCWKAGRIKVLQELKASEKVVALVSNQAGCAFEWSGFTELEIRREIEKAAQEIPADFIATCCTTPNIRALPEYHYPNDPRRKPNPGMILEAMEHEGFAASETLVIGFLPEDQQAAIAALCAFAHVDDFFD